MGLCTDEHSSGDALEDAYGDFPKQVRDSAVKGTDCGSQRDSFTDSSIWGYAFYDADIVSYLFLKTHFVFIDFNKSLAVFLLEHLAMMGFFIFVSFYAAGLLQRTAGRQRKL